MAEDVIIKIKLDGVKQETSNLEKLQKEIKQLGDEKKRLNKNEKELTEAINKSGVATKEQNEALKKINQQQIQNNTSLKVNKTAYRENEAQIIRNTKAQQGNTGSLVQMRAALAKDQRAYDLLSKAERNNEKVGGRLQKSIDKQSNALLNLEKNTGRAQRNVGNYGDAMNDVLPIMGGFGSQIQTVQRTLTGMKGALGKVTTAQGGMTAGTKASTSGLKAFRVALISTGIGAIVVALGALVAAFLSTQRGVDAVTKVLRPLQEVFQSIIGLVQDLATSGLDKLKKIFSDPKQAILDLGNAIKDNIITRVLAIPKVISAAANAIVGSFKLIGLGIKKVFADVPLIGKFIDKKQLEKDLEEAKNQTISSFKELGKATIELQLGVDADTVIEGVKNVAKDSSEFFGEAFDRGAELDRLQKDIERNQITLNRELKAGTRAYEEQKSIAEDTNLTSAERLKAASNAQAILKANVKLENDQLSREIKLAKLKTEANDTDREAQQEIQDLLAQQDENEAKALKKGLLLRNKANSIAQKAEKDRLKAIDDIAETKAGKEKLKQESELIDKQIEALELARQLELATIDETNEEKIKKEAELLDAIAKLRLDKAKKDGEIKAEEDTKGLKDELDRKTQGIKDEQERKKAGIKDEATLEAEKSKIIAEAVLEQDLENKLIKAVSEKEIQDAIDEEELAAEKIREDGKIQIKNAAIAAGEQFAQEIFNNQNRRIEEGLSREVDALNLKREAGEISEEEFNKRRLELDKKAFDDRKRLSQAQNIIDFAVGAGKTIATLGFANPALPFALGALAIEKAAKSAIIASQKFAKGGIIHGASHAFGGVDLGNNQEGEGGEAIINKRSTAKHLPLLSAINQDGGGVPLGNIASPSLGALSKFGNGGITNNVTNQSSQIDLNDLETRIVASMGAIKVQNVASETTEVANRVQSIEDSASF